MFCNNCGFGLKPHAKFCSNCGSDVVKNTEEQPIQNPHDPQVVLGDNLKSREGKNNKKRWIYLLPIAACLFAGLLFLLLNNFQSPAKKEVAIQTEAAASTTGTQTNSNEEEKKAMSKNDDEPNKVQTAPLKPAYLKINQVDSANYENGEVEVYFSLFSDKALKNKLELQGLSKEFFKVNNAQVEELSPLKKSDTVSVNLVLDRSGSMEEAPNNSTSQSKMELVRQAAVAFLENIPSDTSGNFELLTFSSFILTDGSMPFTQDRSSLISSLSSLESDGGDTALYDALTHALFNTNLQNGPKYIIAFTDGEDSGYGASAQSVIDLSKQLGIPIYTIGFEGIESRLEDIALNTGGQHFSIDVTDDLLLELQNIYNQVFNSYNEQYKLTYKPLQQVKQSELFSINLGFKSNEYTGQINQQWTRKIDSKSAEVLRALHEYQVNYASAVNELDFSIVSPYVHPGFEFYENLKNRIEIDYMKNYNEGKKTEIKPIENFRVKSISAQNDGSYKIVFFKLFPTIKNGNSVFEADVNTYTMIKEGTQWKVSEFSRNECSIYTDSSDSGRMCGNGEEKPYNGDPWQNDYN